MTNRTVSVALELRAQQYKTEADEAAARTEVLKTAVDEADKKVDKLGRDSVKAAAELKALGVEAGGTRVKFEDFGRGAGTTLEAVDQRIAATRGSVREFADEFNRTGLVSAFERWKKATQDLSDLEKLRKELGGIVAEVNKLPGFGGSQQQQQQTTLWSLLGKVPGGLSNLLNPTLDKGEGGIVPILTNPAAIGGMVAVASGLGVAIGGAIVTGIGLAGIGAGIALQLHNPDVQAGLSTLKTDVSSGLKDASSSFAGPLKDALATFDATFQNDLPGIKSTFSALAPDISFLARGTASFLSNVLTGFEHAAVAAKPLIQDFSSWLPGFGQQIGGIFDEMAAHEKEAAEGLQMLESFMSGLATAGKYTIPVLSDLWDVAKYFSTEYGTKWAFDSGIKSLTGVDIAAGIATNSSKTLGEAVRGVAGSAASLNTTLGIQLDYWDRINADLVKAAQNFDRVFGITMSSQQAQLGLAQSVTALSDSIDKNGKRWDINTAAGQANRAAVLQEEQAILALRDANIKAGMSADDANAQYEAQQAALRKTLAAAGLTTAQINDLIGAYSQVPDKVDTSVNAPGLTSATQGVDVLGAGYKALPDTINTYINTPGLGSASGAVAQYRDYLNSIPKYLFTQFAINAPGPSSHSASQNRWGGIYEHAATGLLNAGIYPPSNPARYAFAEPATQGEAFIPRNGDMNRSRGIWEYVGQNWLGARSVAGGGGGFGTIVLNHKTQIGASTIVSEVVTYAIDSGRAPSDLWPDQNR